MASLPERDLRAAMRSMLMARADAGEGIALEEMTIEQGGARVDLAFVGRELEAFELKSDDDTFGRLHNQIHAYNRVFDRITLVAGAAHAAAAAAILPNWWGLLIAHTSDGKIVLVQRRAAQLNPKLDGFSLASLLWRAEAIALLRCHSISPRSSRTSRYQLYTQLTENLSVAQLRSAVTACLLQRAALEPATA